MRERQLSPVELVESRCAGSRPSTPASARSCTWMAIARWRRRGRSRRTTGARSPASRSRSRRTRPPRAWRWTFGTALLAGSGPRTTPTSSAACAGGVHHHRDDAAARDGDPADHRAARRRPGTQPVQPRAHARRLVRRVGRRGRRRDAAARARQRRWRLDPDPGRLLRPARPQASRGRISRGPDQGDSFLVVDGVLTHTVLDTAASLDVLAGYEVGDATWAPRPLDSYVKATRREPGHLRVGVTTKNPLDAPLTPTTRRPCARPPSCSPSLGHHVLEIDPRVARRGRAGPVPRRVRRQHLPRRAVRADARRPRAGRGRSRAADPGDGPARGGHHSTELLAATTMLQNLARGVVALWADLDVMLMPALAERPVPIGTIHGALEEPMEAFDACDRVRALRGAVQHHRPARGVDPVGLGSDGLPSAVQLVGPPLGEDTLLQMAAQVEPRGPGPRAARGAAPPAAERYAAEDVGHPARAGRRASPRPRSRAASASSRRAGPLRRGWRSPPGR